MYTYSYIFEDEDFSLSFQNNTRLYVSVFESFLPVQIR